MRKTVKTNALTFLLIATVSLSAGAQIPTVSVYFDSDLQYMSAECPVAPAGTIMETLYIAANNFHMSMSSIEYQIRYSHFLLLLEDIIDPEFQKSGNSVVGIVISFPTPQIAQYQFVVQRAIVLWMCSGCGDPGGNIPVVVHPHPSTGRLGAVRWPDLEFIEAIGMTSLICSILPVEKSSWGQIKALYR